MNKKSFITFVVCIFSLGLVGTSCSDLLSPNMDRYADADQYAKDSVYSEFGILMSIQNVAERTIILDECRSDLVSSGTYTTDSISELMNFQNPEDGSSKLLNVADFYHIVNSCNFYFARVDTLKSKNGVPEMKRAYAAIQGIRAWAYLQLVRLYGNVPFITVPINSTSQAASLEQSAPRVTKENLVDYLIEDGLLNALTIQHSLGLPQYQNTTNGAQSYATTQSFVPVQLVLADAYLLKNDYENAARYYYDFFNLRFQATNNTSYKASSSTIKNNDVITGYYTDANSWVSAFRNHSTSEKYVISVGAANSYYGTVLNDLQHVFGFSTSSTAGTSSGSTSTIATENYQQILPSQQYITLNEAQTFNRYDYDNGAETREPIAGDARLYGTAPVVEFRTSGTKTRFVDKYATGSSSDSRPTTTSSTGDFSMVYEIALYRNPQVWLRYAEAVNRMGFPELAFGVLKDGLYRQTIPSVEYKDLNVYAIIKDADGNKDTIGVVLYDTLHNYVFQDETVGDTITADTLRYADGHTADASKIDVPVLVEPTAYNGGMYYLSLDERLKAEKYTFLDFWTNAHWSSNDYLSKTVYGIHGRGCGDTGGRHDTLFTYAKMVAKKVAENHARLNNLSYDAQIAYEETLHKGDTLLVTDKDLIMNAVEDLIVDEGALETAFEGQRFTDLMRIAGHKTNAGMNGNAWLAWKVARRDNKYTDDANSFDGSLFSKLQSSSNWFYQLHKQ